MTVLIDVHISPLQPCASLGSEWLHDVIAAEVRGLVMHVAFGVHAEGKDGGWPVLK